MTARGRTAVAAVAAVVIAAAAANSHAAPPRSAETRSAVLFDAEQLFSLRRAVATLDRAKLTRLLERPEGGARRCRIKNDSWACRDLRIATSEWLLRADRWSAGDDGSRIRDLRFRARSGALRGAAAHVRLIDESVRLRRLRLAGRRRQGIRSNTARLERRAIAFRTVRWVAFEPEESDARIPRFRRSRRPSLRADRVRYREGAWSFDGLRAAGWLPLRLGPLAGGTTSRASGLFPPDFAYSARRLEGRIRALHGPSGLGVTAAAAPGGWYGLGPALLVEPDDTWPTEGRGPSLLETHLLYDTTTRSLEVAAFGDLRLGSRYTHLAGSFEETTLPDLWRTRRLERPGFLAPRRRSAAGASLSGAAHHLQIRGAHWTDADLGLRRLEAVPFDALPAGDEMELQIRFGTETPITECLDLSAEFFHRNFVRERATNSHGTALAAVASGLLGRLDRVYAEAHLASHVGAGFVSTSGDIGGPGFQAVPVTQIVGGLRGGLSLRGEWSDTLHLVRPTATIYREIAGRGTGGGASTPFRAPFRRIPRWTLAALSVDQTLRHDDLSVGFPTGVLVHGEGLAGAFTQPGDLFARLEFDYTALGVRGGIVAPTDLAEIDWFGRLHWHRGRWSVSTGVTTLQPAAFGIVYADRILPEPADALRLIEGQDLPGSNRARAEVGKTVSHLSLHWSRRTHSIETTTWTEGQLDRVGLAAGWSIRFPRVGWGLGLDARILFPAASWGASLGLVTPANRRPNGPATW